VDEYKPLVLGRGVTATVSSPASASTSVGVTTGGGTSVVSVAGGRGLHSTTFRLDISTFCGIHRVHDFPPVY
jgi:hypothetical protein